MRAQARRAPAPPPARAPEPPGPPPPSNLDYDPLDALVQRSAAGLRRAVVLEQAVLSRAQAPDTAEATGVAATKAAARKALALRRGATAAQPRPIALRHVLLTSTSAVPVEPAPAAISANPRRTRGP